MHEATIAQSILNIARSKLRSTPNASSISAVHVIVGEFRNVDPESLQFAFDQLKLLEDDCSLCKLETDIVEARASCRSGGHIYRPEFEKAFKCDECGDGIGKMFSGEELDIVGITLLANQMEQEKHARACR